MVKSNTHIRLLGLLFLAGLSYSAVSWSQNQLYRYTNAQGNVVLNHMIPAQYAQKGYDILNSSGKVIKSVPAAPTDDEISRRETMRQFDKLYRRFRSVEEINFAKKRVIEDIESSISIVQGNINTINKELTAQKQRAAAIERQGKNVPVHLMDQISAIQTELSVTKDLLVKREQDKQEQQNMYDNYMFLFEKGLAMKLKDLKLQSSSN